MLGYVEEGGGSSARAAAIEAGARPLAAVIGVLPLGGGPGESWLPRGDVLILGEGSSCNMKEEEMDLRERRGDRGRMMALYCRGRDGRCAGCVHGEETMAAEDRLGFQVWGDEEEVGERNK